MARVAWTNTNYIGQNSGNSVLGGTNEPAVGDYTCITPADATGSGYDTTYFAAYKLTKFTTDKTTIFSYQPYRINDLNSTPTIVQPPVFNYNGFGIIPITGVANNTP